MPKATIRNRIRALRFAHGEMTQQALADAVGCTRQTIMMLEQERYVPSLVLAMRIAQTFQQPIEAVFTLDE
ncbi:MAG: helix-turn-helix transcriptional regulator [Gemmatimonadaceae bacterium]|jgi:putative transcriptional regulator|nr:helix-turn-helix transcriptional regulator [Gemmatimonadaceae bacterium]